MNHMLLITALLHAVAGVIKTTKAPFIAIVKSANIVTILVIGGLKAAKTDE